MATRVLDPPATEAVTLEVPRGTGTAIETMFALIVGDDKYNQVKDEKTRRGVVGRFLMEALMKSVIMCDQYQPPSGKMVGSQRLALIEAVTASDDILRRFFTIDGWRWSCRWDNEFTGSLAVEFLSLMDWANIIIETGRLPTQREQLLLSSYYA